MATFSANFSELMETRDKVILFKEFSQIAQLFRLLFKTRPSTKAFEDRMRVRGLTTLQTKGEGQPVAFADPREGTRRRVVHTMYALGYRVTHEAVMDDQWNILNQMPADLGDSLRDHQERVVWDVLNDAFDGDRHTTVDNDALFTTHTGLGGYTATNNALAPAFALSVTGLETVMSDARTTESEEGRFIRMDQAILVYHPDNDHNAHVLLNTEFRPGTADNDVSTVASTRSGIKPLDHGVPYLTSTTQWSLHGGIGNNGLHWNDREEPMFSSAQDADTFDRKHYVAYRGSPQVDEWRNNWGSQGTV